MWDVVEWAHSNVWDVNRQRVSRQYLRRALLFDATRWNSVRRGLMAPWPAVPEPLIEIQVRVENALVCTICFDSVPPEARQRLPCMHAFHRACIGTWLRTQRTCPICRRGL
jgi:hypothetical protein